MQVSNTDLTVYFKPYESPESEKETLLPEKSFFEQNRLLQKELNVQQQKPLYLTESDFSDLEAEEEDLEAQMAQLEIEDPEVEGRIDELCTPILRRAMPHIVRMKTLFNETVKGAREMIETPRQYVIAVWPTGASIATTVALQSASHLILGPSHNTAGLTLALISSASLLTGAIATIVRSYNWEGNEQVRAVGSVTGGLLIPISILSIPVLASHS